MSSASSRSRESASNKEVDKKDDEKEDRKQLDSAHVDRNCESSDRAGSRGSESGHEAAPECEGALKSRECTGFCPPEPPPFHPWKPFRHEGNVN